MVEIVRVMKECTCGTAVLYFAMASRICVGTQARTMVAAQKAANGSFAQAVLMM